MYKCKYVRAWVGTNVILSLLQDNKIHRHLFLFLPTHDE